MRLVSRIKKVACTLAFAPLATLAVSQQASAIDLHGTACQPYWNQSAAGLNYFVDGIRNEGTAPRYVMCPVPRMSEVSQHGPTVYVTGSNSPGAQTNCTAYSAEYWSGSIYAAKSFTATGGHYNPSYNRALFFTNAEMPWGAYVSVLCYLPPNKTGVLRGVGTFR